MTKEFYEQLKPAHDDEGRAQFEEQYNPPAPVGVSDWVAYTGDIPVLRFSDTAPATLLALQVWDSIPTVEEVMSVFDSDEKSVSASALFVGSSSFSAGFVAEEASFEGDVLFSNTSGGGFAGKKQTIVGVVVSNNSSFLAVDGIVSMMASASVVFINSASPVASGWKASFVPASIICVSRLGAGGAPTHRSPFVAAFFANTSVLGIDGRKIFSFSQIKEAEVATITQGERVTVRFTQGESVERNVFFFLPDGVTPVSDLQDYTARMELREYPDDPTPLTILTSAASNIFLSSTGLIVWEIPGSITKTFEAPTFFGDLFVYAPDGDAVMVCGFDFEMNLSHTREA